MLPSENQRKLQLSGKNVPFYRNIWLWIAIGGIAGVTLIRPYTRHVPDPPKVQAQLPEFTLTDQDGREFGSKDLAGTVYVVSFFFTSCVTVCPKLMEALKKLHDRYEKMEIPVQLISITVDPDNDTPKVLAAYAKKLGTNPERWHFLTGNWDLTRKLVVEGFVTHMGQREVDDSGVIDIGHGARIVLVDNAGGIRGNYETTKMGLDEIYHRSKHILRDLQRSPGCSTSPHLR